MSEWAVQIPEDIFRAFSSDPFGPLDRVALFANDPSSPLHEQLCRFLESIPAEAVAATMKDEVFIDLYGEASDLGQRARVWFAERFLIEEISRKRLMLIRDENRTPRPAPYDTPALRDIEVGYGHLVHLSNFQFDESRLVHNGYAFTVLPTTDSPNSTYWLIRAIYSESLANHISVRLDPFLWGSVNTFPAVFYSMRVYGTPLDWERIRVLQEPEHGRWCPDRSDNWSELTEYSWSPRGNEIHFVCEEIPKAPFVLRRGSRYLHAIYAPNSEMITHLDGALRIYTPEELGARQSEHVRNTGKVGTREKVFRIDKPISRNCFSLIAQAFFICNKDVRDYFRSGAQPSGAAV